MRDFLTQVLEYCPELKRVWTKNTISLIWKYPFFWYLVLPVNVAWTVTKKKSLLCVNGTLIKKKLILLFVGSVCCQGHHLIPKDYGTMCLKNNCDPVFKEILFCRCRDWFCCFIVPLNRKSRLYISIKHTFCDIFFRIKSLWTMNSLNSPLWSYHFT